MFMRFEFEVTDTLSRITPFFEEDDSWEGERAEGVGNFINYSGQPIEFHYPVKSIHPDLLGLMCLCIFHPFIGSSTFLNRLARDWKKRFGMSVSRRPCILKTSTLRFLRMSAKKLLFRLVEELTRLLSESCFPRPL